MTKYTLRALEGDLITGIFPSLRQTTLQVRLLKVEDFGIWVESQDIMDQLLKLQGTTSEPTSLAFFVPWNGVKVIYAGIPVPAISNKLL